MNLEDSRIYKSLIQEPFHKVAKKVLRWTEEGRDVNFRDDRGRSYLHIIAENADKFLDARAVPVVYQLCLSGINVDAVNTDGDTCLHMVVRRQGTYRIVIALLRCGADPLIKDKNGVIPADIITRDKPPGWEETLYWFNTFSPGLKNLVSIATPDLHQIETLLSSWCRSIVYKNGRMVSLMDELKDGEARDSDVINLLQRHMATNELAVAVLAGSKMRIGKIEIDGSADVNALDMSYRYHYPHSPEVPQPLLAVAWEQNNYDSLDALMSLHPDSGLLYTNHTNKPAKPLFFHVISGRPRPDSASLVHRILRSSDLTRRNHKGQSILYEAIKYKTHLTIFKSIIQYGADVSSRDYKGHTARDYAESLGEMTYVKAIDDSVVDEINERNLDFIERVVMKSYDHVTDMTKSEQVVNKKLCERLKENRLYKPMNKYLLGIPRLERICKKIHQIVDICDLDGLKKYAKGQVSTCQNKCGQTLLHRAILSRDVDFFREVVQLFPHLVDLADNLDRTPLHYAHLLLTDITELLLDYGARDDLTDVVGRLPSDYRKECLTTHEYNILLKEVMDFESKVILLEMNFETELNRAIACGEMKNVQSLVNKAGQHAKMTTYSSVTFDCLDHGQPDIAIFLLQSGCDPNIWKQYEKCDPTEDACALRKCKHPVISLQQRASQLHYVDVVEYIVDLKRSKMRGDGDDDSDAFQILGNYGVPT